LPWTESRSREEWLAEVRRRGERIRRRRLLAVSAVGAVALLAPAFAVASYTIDGDRGRRLQVAAEGPPPSRGATGPSLPSVIAGGQALSTTTTLAGAEPLPEVTAPSGPLYSTTTTAADVNRRASPTTVVPSYDDPVVRPTPSTTVTDGNSSRSSGATTSPTVTTLPPPPGEPTLSACPTGDVKVTVVVGKPTYAPGETVSWSSTIENRSPTACLMSGRAFFHVEDTAGKIVGSFAYTADYMLPVKAEPGKTITNSGTWDQKDCSGPACTQVPAGAYVVVAGWTEGGPWTGRGSFQIGA
jgi:hypothetical protein